MYPEVQKNLEVHKKLAANRKGEEDVGVIMARALNLRLRLHLFLVIVHTRLVKLSAHSQTKITFLSQSYCLNLFHFIEAGPVFFKYREWVIC